MFPHLMGLTCYILHLSLCRCFQNLDKAKPNSGKLAPCVGRRQGNEICSGVCGKDGSVSKGSCYQAWQPRFDPWVTHVGRRELLQVCPLVYTYMLWHICAGRCVYTHTSVKQCNKNVCFKTLIDN